MDRRTRPERIAAVLRDSRRRRHRAAGSDRRRTRRRQPHRGDRRGARHGMGDGADPPPARPPVRQRDAQPLFRSPSTPNTTSRGSACEERCMQRVDIDVGSHRLHVYNVHLGTAILERRHQARRLATIVSDRHVSGPKIVLGDFNEWMKGLTTTPPELEAQKRRSGQLSEAPPHISRPFPHPASRPHLLFRASGNRRNQPRSD